MQTTIAREFLNFLQTEIAIPATDLQLALRHPEQTPDRLPMILWQYGLITLNQLDRIFEWSHGVGSSDRAYSK
jgi:Protein of unknown function (DUF2949)